MATLIGALGLTLVSAVARQQPTALPAPTGSHSVGVASLHWIDAGRVAPAGQGRRRIDLTVFYPALPGGSPAQYMVREVARARVSEHGAARVFFSDPASIHSSARIGAPPWQVSRVIVFLPGAGQSVAEYSSLLEDQASSGVVVLAMDPAGNAPTSDGRGGVVPADPAVYSAPEDPAELMSWGNRIVADWAADVAYVVGRASAHPSEIPGLSQRRPQPAGVVGHSIGGAAALSACASMSGCAFAADLDGWVFGTVTSAAIHHPLLFLSSPVTGCDDACHAAQKRHQTVLDSATPRAIDHTLPGFAHLDFTDHAVEFDPMLHLLGLLGSSNGISAVRTVRAELRAFENTYLPGDPEPRTPHA